MSYPLTPIDFDDSYRSSWDYLMHPEKYARQEYVRHYGEPRTDEDRKAMQVFIALQQKLDKNAPSDLDLIPILIEESCTIL